MILMLTLIFRVSSSLSGQSCQIVMRGTVQDKATGEALEYSSIALKETNTLYVADSLGYFQIPDLCPGAYHFQVTHLGCPPAQFYFSIQNDTVVAFLLEHHDEILREITVQGKQGSFRETNTQQSISIATIQNQSGQTLADLTEQIAGVRAIRNGSGIGKPVVHGLYGNRVAIINNGLLQAGQQWGADHAPEIDPNAAGSITVIKGSDAIEYGAQALGGALVVEAGPINSDPHLHGRLSYAVETNGWGNTLTGSVTRSFSKLDTRLTGTWKKAGDQHTPDYFLTNTGVGEWNVSLQAVCHKDQSMSHQVYYSLFNTMLGIFAGSHISNLTDLEEAVGREVPFNVRDSFSYIISPPKQEVQHHLLRYTGKKFLPSNRYMEWSYGVQSNHRQEFDIRRGDRSDIPALDLQMWAHQVQFKFIHEGSMVHYKIGSNLSYTDNENDYDTGILPLIPDYRNGMAGVYGIVTFPLGRLQLESGLRYDLQMLKAWPITKTLPRMIVETDHVFHNLAISAGALYAWPGEAESRIQLAVVNRPPEVNELYSNGLHQGVAGIEEGNWDLEPELSFKTIFTQTYSLEEAFRFEFTAYSHLIYRYIYLKPEDEYRLTIRGAFPVFVYTQEDAWIRGMDFLVISDFSHHLEWNLKLSVVRGSTLEDKRPLTYIPPAYISTGLSWAFHDSKLWIGPKISLEGSYTAEQKHWDEESELYPPPDDYFLMGARFDSGVRVGREYFHFGLSLDNLFNIRYRDYLNRLRYYSDEAGFNARILVRYEF